MNSKRNLGIPLLLFRQLRSTILNMNKYFYLCVSLKQDVRKAFVKFDSRH